MLFINYTIISIFTVIATMTENKLIYTRIRVLVKIAGWKYSRGEYTAYIQLKM